ncbi:hypothetical protein LEP1GSC176_1800 [Leptospira kirschneri str. MMD1493]|nr:hypothetical protein LEP1GSC176_1800 [Leptospira kirschneri str. MMD1493]
MGLVWSTFAFYSGFSFIVFGINSLIAYKNRRIQGSKEFLLVVTGLALYCIHLEAFLKSFREMKNGFFFGTIFNLSEETSP